MYLACVFSSKYAIWVCNHILVAQSQMICDKSLFEHATMYLGYDAIYSTYSFVLFPFCIRLVELVELVKFN